MALSPYANASAFNNNQQFCGFDIFKNIVIFKKKQESEMT